MKKCTTWPRCGCIVRGYILPDGTCGSPNPESARRAIYIGPPAEGQRFLLNYGITGHMIRQYGYVGRPALIWFHPDGQKISVAVELKHLYICKD